MGKRRRGRERGRTNTRHFSDVVNKLYDAIYTLLVFYVHISKTTTWKKFYVTHHVKPAIF